MPRVTGLEPQLKRKGRVSVFVDGVFAAGLSEELAAHLGLAVGAEVGAADVAALAAAAEVERAYERACRYLRARPRSRREVERRLARYGYDEDVRAAVVTLLTEEGALDDRAFAGAWVRDRMALRPRGARALRAELAAKGVPADDIAAALAADYAGDEFALARRALGSRGAAFAARGEKRGRAALYGFLGRRGFGGDVIRRLADELFRTG